MSDTVMETWSSMETEPLSCVFKSLQRLNDSGFACHGRLALFFFLLDDLFLRVGDEFLVAQLGVDALDVGIGLGQFLVEPRLLGNKIDHAFQGQGRDLAAYQQLHPASP